MSVLFKRTKKEEQHSATINLLDDAIAQMDITVAKLEELREQAISLREQHSGREGG